MEPTDEELLLDIAARRRARTHLLDYIVYTSQTYIVSSFAEIVCSALDKFLRDVRAGRRPVLILQAPPQHGKSEIVSRKLPAWLMGIDSNLRVGGISYAADFAHSLAQTVRRTLMSFEHSRLFPVSMEKRKYERNTVAEFTTPGGNGSYISAGIGGPLPGRPLDIGIIDDPTKDQAEALSQVTKENHWNWYQSVFTSRLSQNSGQIIMATAWAQDDLPARILNHFAGDARLTHLRFPAINDPLEVGYQPQLPLGALIPQLHSLPKLLEQKALMSDFWWSALYQQSAKTLGGNVFKEKGVRFYKPADLPERFDLVIDSWDCTFKDTDGTDYVVGGKWGKKGANSYLLQLRRARMGFTETALQVEELANQRPIPYEILIEDKANGPAVIDFLKKRVPRLVAIEPDGSKLARAYAVTSVWESGNVFVPHPDIAPWVGRVDGSHPTGSYLGELTGFPAAANDDQVDMTTQALRRLYPFFGGLSISKDALKAASRR